MSRLMWIAFVVLTAAVFATGCAGTAGVGGDWVRQAGGAGFAGWRGPADPPADDWVDAGGVALAPEDGKKLVFKPGAGVLVNGTAGRTRHLFTEAEYGDVQAHIEFMVPEGSNSGVYFMGRYEIQVLDSFGREKVAHSDCGGIYQRWDSARGKGKEGYEGRPPRTNASRAPGEWQTFDVIFRAPRFDGAGKKTADAAFVKVVHNGVTIHENETLSGPTRAAAFSDEKGTGPLMFQGDHGPVAYGNIWVRPLDLVEVEVERTFSSLLDVRHDGKTIPQWGAAIVANPPELSVAAARDFARNQSGATPQLSRALAHPDQAMRLRASDALGNLGPRSPALRKQLASLLGDDSLQVQMASAFALRGTSCHDDAIGVLAGLVEKGEKGAAIAAAGYLRRIGPGAADAVTALEKMAESFDDDLSGAARDALTRIQH
jgi:hypothetical protein